MPQTKHSRGEASATQERRGTQGEARQAHEEHGRGGEHKAKVDLNAADQKELEQLTMMGPERAKALIDHRPLRSWEDVEKVPGFSSGMIEDLKESGATVGGQE